MNSSYRNSTLKKRKFQRKFPHIFGDFLCLFVKDKKEAGGGCDFQIQIEQKLIIFYKSKPQMQHTLLHLF
ncbi:hypothetical protein BpHYR1_040592 [Brachionus plicatilis]|uniref:Uncharacterized protein n=1 Tax=Brachionus plicatilis TaxID=10195 RepID=A0A3M7RIH3_BRAPC|nr:hypothetical protein BpHYR1_040592 [Brachionus plicatilis]